MNITELIDDIIKRDPDDITADEFARILVIVQECRDKGFITDEGKVRKVPTTADGAMVLPGMVVYAPAQHAAAAPFSIAEIYVVAVYDGHVRATGEVSDTLPYLLNRCYSTREAAEAARGAGQ